MHSVVERLVDSSLEDATLNEAGASSSSSRVKIQQEIDAGTGKCVYGWQSGSGDSPLVFDFLDTFGGQGRNSQPQIPFYPNLAM